MIFFTSCFLLFTTGYGEVGLTTSFSDTSANPQGMQKYVAKLGWASSDISPHLQPHSLPMAFELLPPTYGTSSTVSYCSESNVPSPKTVANDCSCSFKLFKTGSQFSDLLDISDLFWILEFGHIQLTEYIRLLCSSTHLPLESSTYHCLLGTVVATFTYEALCNSTNNP